MNRSNNSPSKETINELVIRARDGSQEALSELKTHYAPLIESQISKHSLPDMSRQDVVDLREEALIIFCSAVCNYNSSVDGVEFGLYAKICIENGLISYGRSYLRRKKRPILPLERTELFDGDSPNFLQNIVDEENAADLVRLIGSKLSDYENRVWWMYVSGMSVSDIASNLKIADCKSVSNAIYRIRKKLKGLLVDRNYF